MKKKYPPGGIGALDADMRKWYEAEQCWNCEPEDLRKLLHREKSPAKSWHITRRF